MSDEPKCMYCLEYTPQLSNPVSSPNLVRLGCACKGSLGLLHIYCKAKFARFKTFSSESTPRSREYYWTHCELCHEPLKNGERVIQLAKERSLQCLYYQYGIEKDVSNEAFWKELCMSACFFATTIVKKCKGYGKERDTVLYSKEEVPFWIESCNILSSTIQLLQHLNESTRQIALWSAEMKFVDCVYYVFQMMMDKSTSLEENELAFVEALKLLKRYKLCFSSLALSMFEMKKFAEDVNKKTGGKRDSKGCLMLTREETMQYDRLKVKIVEEMELANESGGADRHSFSEQLSCQVEFINFETYGKQEKADSVR